MQVLDCRICVWVIPTETIQIIPGVKIVQPLLRDITSPALPLRTFAKENSAEKQVF